MKLRWLHFLIASQLLFSSAGWGASVHFCSKFGSSAGLFSKKCGGCHVQKTAKSCCEKPAPRLPFSIEKGFSKPKSCCSDATVFFQIQSEKETPNSFKINELAQKAAIEKPLILAFLPPVAEAFSAKLVRLFLYRPPPSARVIWRLVGCVRC